MKTRTKLSIKNIEVTDIVNEEEFALQILHGLKPYVYDGMDVREF